jgi:hypothetical protein
MIPLAEEHLSSNRRRASPVMPSLIGRRPGASRSRRVLIAWGLVWSAFVRSHLGFFLLLLLPL